MSLGYRRSDHVWVSKSQGLLAEDLVNNEVLQLQKNVASIVCSIQLNLEVLSVVILKEV